MIYKELQRRHSESPSEESILHVSSLFQPAPTYIEKQHGQTWQTVHGSLFGDELQKKVFFHMSPSHDVSLGTLARWYPTYLELDVDHGGRQMCQRLQAALKLRDDQVQVYRSERKDGYHLRCQVSQTSSATREYFYQKLKFLEDVYGAEVYPRATRHVRLPFDSRLQPVDRINGLHINDLVNDFIQLEPLSLENFDWPSADWVAPEESRFRRQSLGEYSYGRGEEALQHGLSGPGQRYKTQWDMMRVLRKRGFGAKEAIHEVFTTLQTKGYTSRDLVTEAKRVIRELEWCAKAIWKGETVTDHIRRDALPLWVNIAGSSFPFLRFCLGIVSYLTARYEPGRWIPLPRKVIYTFVHPRNAVQFVEKLIQLGFIERDNSYSVGRRSKAVRIIRPELLGTEQPYFADNFFPMGGLEALKSDTKLYRKAYASMSQYQRQELTRRIF